MALTFEFKNVENWQEIPGGTRECMVWACMFVGISEITEKNWREFAKRLHMHETAYGPIRADGERTDPGVVRDCIGLYTNVSRMTAAQFNKKITQRNVYAAEEALARFERSNTE